MDVVIESKSLSGYVRKGLTEWPVLTVAEEDPKDAALSLSPGWSPSATPLDSYHRRVGVVLFDQLVAQRPTGRTERQCCIYKDTMTPVGSTVPGSRMAGTSFVLWRTLDFLRKRRGLLKFKKLFPASIN